MFPRAKCCGQSKSNENSDSMHHLLLSVRRSKVRWWLREGEFVLVLTSGGGKQFGNPVTARTKDLLGRATGFDWHVS